MTSRYCVLASPGIKDKGGAAIVYEMETLEEVRCIRAVRPVGNNNCWNKINRPEGTSH